MKDEPLKALIDDLETRTDMSKADFDRVADALVQLLPEALSEADISGHAVSVTDGAIDIVDRAYPNWNIHIRGRANDTDGHWHCTLREGDMRDNDAVIGSGRAPVLAQAILAAVLRLSETLR